MRRESSLSKIAPDTMPGTLWIVPKPEIIWAGEAKTTYLPASQDLVQWYQQNTKWWSPIVDENYDLSRLGLSGLASKMRKGIILAGGSGTDSTPLQNGM